MSEILRTSKLEKEVNYTANIVVDETGGVGASFIGRPSINRNCDPWLDKVWSDAKVGTFYGE